jgi:hypothetical protein
VRLEIADLLGKLVTPDLLDQLVIRAIREAKDQPETRATPETLAKLVLQVTPEIPETTVRQAILDRLEKPDLLV